MGSRSGQENTTGEGMLTMSHHHVALLLGLASRPGGYAASKKEWMESAMEVARDLGLDTSTSNLRHATDTLDKSWIETNKVSSRVEVTLSPLGRRTAFEIAHGQRDVFLRNKQATLWKSISKGRLGFWARIIGIALSRPAEAQT